MSQFFYYILNMSITATVIGAILLLLRKVKRIPRHPLYTLWILVAVRLCFPFALSSQYSLFTLTKGLIKRVVTVPAPFIGPNELDWSISNSLGAADHYFPLSFKTNRLEHLFGVFSTLWLIGVVISILFVIILYFLAARGLNKGTLLRENIYMNPFIQSPILLGIFSPKVMIPRGLAENPQALHYVMLHERVHMKRQDNLLRLLGIFIACIHWFNPFVWLFLQLFLNDMEITCDSKAIQSLSQPQRKEYAQVLMNMNTQKPLSISAAFGESNPYTRVINVITYKKISIVALIFSILMMLVLSIAFLSNPIL